MSSLSSVNEAVASPATRLVVSPPNPLVPHAGSATADGAALAESYRTVRRCTGALCEPLESEDYVVQSMPDASPVKWHLAHTTWFFETFLLAPHLLLPSTGKHATKHFNETGHPVMRSAMPGATWTWCYLHEAEGRLGQDALDC